MFTPISSLKGLFEDAFMNAESYPAEYMKAMAKIKRIYNDCKAEIKKANTVEELQNVEVKISEICEDLYYEIQDEINNYGGIQDANNYLEDALFELIDKQYDKL